MKHLFTWLFFLITLTHLSAQITTNPAFPVATQSVTITFDSSKDSRLGYFTGDLYAHTGVMIEGNTNWQHVIGSWGDNTVQPQLTYQGNGIYTLTITPDINTYYSVSDNETVTQLAFVFRSADGTSQTTDLFANVYQSSLAINLTAPTSQLIHQNENITVSAEASVEAELSLKLDETTLATTTGSSISTTATFSETGWK